jgi:thiol:disulfide interchange protein DsbC
MNTHQRLLLGLAAAACVAGLALAATGAPTPTPPATPPATPLQAELAAVVAHLPGAKAGDVRTTPVAGLYEYRKGAQLLYVTADGRFGLAGDLYQLGDNTNLSDIRRRELRLALINAVPESSMVVFAPASAAKYTITVFTDVDCGYCRALHRQISEYNRLGVKVRYLFFPRTGPNTESWSKAEQVWCSSDRRAALTQAKQGEPLKAAVCHPNPVAEQYALGQAIGLQGTPGIVTGSGDLLPGYAPPEALIEELKQDPHAADPPAG